MDVYKVSRGFCVSPYNQPPPVLPVENIYFCIHQDFIPEYFFTLKILLILINKKFLIFIKVKGGYKTLLLGVYKTTLLRGL